MCINIVEFQGEVKIVKLSKLISLFSINFVLLFQHTLMFWNNIKIQADTLLGYFEFFCYKISAR